jgi:hypothetical protein
METTMLWAAWCPIAGLERLAMDVSDSSGASPFAERRKLVAVLVCESMRRSWPASNRTSTNMLAARVQGSGGLVFYSRMRLEWD